MKEDKVTKELLSNMVADELLLPIRQVRPIVNQVFIQLIELMKVNDTFSVRKFGTFKAKQTKERRYKHPKTGELKIVEPRRQLKFRCAKTIFKGAADEQCDNA